ncbi:pectinesterase inhibitor 9 [Elaeis guineensis]|uniref:Pectinesterase inhibitor 9 n=1 Tax=Elaeis guineensis var. tenera TaxID=51953 RepID=A0A6I9RYQ6_ELAGV|nr:pectinesterase inhibitor 9 [Elaeis guineensis]
MAEATASKLSLLLLLLCISAGELTSAATSSTDFIRSSCGSTTYPALCVKCLSAYAPSVRRSPRELARAALTVSADRARSASAYIARLSAGGGSKAINAREAGAVRDCLDNMADSVDQLRQSAQEMGRLGRAGSAGFMWHLSNVQTWCSAALTDENTCLDSLSQSGSGGAAKEAIRKKVVEVAQLTSNALVLVNRNGPNY